MVAINRPSQPTEDDVVQLDEAFYHPAFGVVLWHHYPDFERATFVMSARLNDETRAQAFVDDFTERLELDDKPRFSAN
jgi:hypothetical protein